MSAQQCVVTGCTSASSIMCAQHTVEAALYRLSRAEARVKRLETALRMTVTRTHPRTALGRAARAALDEKEGE